MFSLSPLMWAEMAFGTLIIGYLLFSTKQLEMKEDKEHLGRVPYLDFLKGVAIIAVVAIHATALIPRMFSLNNVLWFAMPFFVMASGYLLSIRHPVKLDIKHHLQRVLFRIIIVYAFFLIVIRLVEGRGFNLSLFGKDLLFGMDDGSLYFIPLMIQLYLVFPLLLPLRKWFTNRWVLTASFLISFLFWQHHAIIQQHVWNNDLWFLIFFGRYFFYFTFGIYLSDLKIGELRWHHLSRLIIYYVLGTILFSLTLGYFHQPFLYPAIALLLFLIVHNSNHKKTPWLDHAWVNTLGMHSLIIYLVHGRILFGIMPLFLERNPLPPWINYIFIISLTLALSYAISLGFMLVYKRCLALCRLKL
ncbi:MAG: acyltransferase [Nanoarchaeota archaeon]